MPKRRRDKPNQAQRQSKRPLSDEERALLQAADIAGEAGAPDELLLDMVDASAPNLLDPLVEMGLLERDGLLVRRALGGPPSALDPAQRRELRLLHAAALDGLWQTAEEGDDTEARRYLTPTLLRAIENLATELPAVDAADLEEAAGLLLDLCTALQEVMPGAPTALSALRATLRALDKRRHRRLWADAQQRLGSALSAEGSGVEQGDASLEAFRQAAAALQREEEPLEWALAQNLVGDALLIREGGDPLADATEAAAAYRAALEVLDESEHREEWAATQASLGIALSAGDAGDSLDQALSAFRGAEAALSVEDQPAWSEVLSDLGTTYRLLDPTEEHLRAAADAYRRGAEGDLRTLASATWASLKSQEGTALEELAELADAKERGALLGAAERAYRDALEANAGGEDPLSRGMTLNNLVSLLCDRHAGEASAGGVAGEALDACHEALGLIDRVEHPATWVALQHNLGDVHALLFAAQGEHGGAARRSYEAALAVCGDLVEEDGEALLDEIRASLGALASEGEG